MNEFFIYIFHWEINSLLDKTHPSESDRVYGLRDA